MPFYAMCQSAACPSQSSCRRHDASGTQRDPERQTYNDFDEVRDGAAFCVYLMQIPNAPDPETLAASLYGVELDG
jgi:hypothetical protein